MEPRSQISIEKRVKAEMEAMIIPMGDVIRSTNHIHEQVIAGLAIVGELYNEAAALYIEAKQAAEEVKQNPGNLYYIRERARRISALEKKLSEHIIAAGEAGKLTVPKVPGFEETFAEVIRQMAIHQPILKPLTVGDHGNKVVNEVFAKCKAGYESLIDSRKIFVRNKNAMLDLSEKCSEISVQLLDADIKRSRELTNGGEEEFAAKLSEAEAQVLYAKFAKEVKAQGPVVLDEKEQKELGFSESPSIVMPTFNLEAVIGALAHVPVPAKRSSTSGITAAVSTPDAPPALKRESTPPTPPAEIKTGTPPTPPGMVRTTTSTPNVTPPRTPTGSISVTAADRSASAPRVAPPKELARTELGNSLLTGSTSPALHGGPRKPDEQPQAPVADPRAGCCNVM